MPIIRPSKDDLAKARRKTDWRRLDALSDKAIGRAIAQDPDAAPAMSRALRRGAFRRVDPRSGEIDVYAVCMQLSFPPTRSPPAHRGQPRNGHG